MNDFKHVSNSIATLIGDKIRLEQFCYSSLHPQYPKDMPAYPRGLDLTQSHNHEEIGDNDSRN